MVERDDGGGTACSPVALDSVGSPNPLVAMQKPAVLVVLALTSCWLTTRVDREVLGFGNRDVAQARTVPVQLKRFRLPNGLRVIIAEDHTLPIVSVSVAYNVGANDDPQSQDGMAHLVEHMMFKGSTQVADGEQYDLVAEGGGYTAGLTDATVTIYNTTIPSNQLEMVLFLEADRMQALRITEEALANQKLAVKNENEGNARSDLPSLLVANLTNTYRLLIDRITVADVERFYEQHYGPNNAVLSISGDVSAKSVEAVTRNYFGAIPRTNLVRREESPTPTPKRETFTDIQRKRRAVFLAFPALPDTDGRDVGPMVQEFLSSNRPALRRAIGGTPTAVVSVLLRYHARTRFLVVSAEVPDGKTTSEVEAALATEVRALAIKGPSQEEVERSKRRALVVAARRALSGEFRAEGAAKSELLYGDARFLNRQEEWIRSLRASDLTKWATAVLSRAPAFVLLADPGASGGTQ